MLYKVIKDHEFVIELNVGDIFVIEDKNAAPGYDCIRKWVDENKNFCWFAEMDLCNCKGVYKGNCVALMIKEGVIKEADHLFYVKEYGNND